MALSLTRSVAAPPTPDDPPAAPMAAAPPAAPARPLPPTASAALSLAISMALSLTRSVAAPPTPDDPPAAPMAAAPPAAPARPLPPTASAALSLATSMALSLTMSVAAPPTPDEPLARPAAPVKPLLPAALAAFSLTSPPALSLATSIALSLAAFVACAAAPVAASWSADAVATAPMALIARHHMRSRFMARPVFVEGSVNLLARMRPIAKVPCVAQAAPYSSRKFAICASKCVPASSVGCAAASFLLHFRAHQNDEPACARKAISCVVDARPNAVLRCGKRPKRAMMSRCRCA